MSLSKADWTEAALHALAADGLAGVAVEPLARRLGATKGSFYWHFADRAELVAATLELWEQRETIEVIEVIEAISDPRERLGVLGIGAYTAAARGNAHAALLAAAAHQGVRAVLERVTHTRLAFLERLYLELGVKPAQAGLRSRLAYALYLGIGELRLADADSDPTGPDLDAYLKLAVAVMMPERVGDAFRLDEEPEPTVSSMGTDRYDGTTF